MPIVPGGGDRWAGRRAIEAVIVEALILEISDDDARRILGKEFDFVVTDAARRVIAERKAGPVYDAIFETIKQRALAGDAVYLSGLGAFELSESKAGAGAVYPAGVSVGPLHDGWELQAELREAVFICGDDRTGPGAVWALGDEWLSWAHGEFALINAPFYASPWNPGEWVGPLSWYKIKAQIIRVEGALTGQTVSIAGHWWAIAQGVWHTVDGQYYLEVTGWDSSEFKVMANDFYGYDYAGSEAGAWLAGASERVGVDSEKMPPASAYYAEGMPQMSAAWMLKGYPREVVMMGLEGAGVGDPSWAEVEWLNSEEFNLRFGYARAAWEAQGVAWPELPVKSNKNARLICRFDDEVKAALNEAPD